MQSERHIITLDSDINNTYLTGTTINGSIQLLCTNSAAANKGRKIRGVCFRIVGRGKCGWTALQGKQRSPLDQSLPNDVCVTTPFMSSTTPATPTTSTRNGPQRISTADEHHAEEYESGTALRPKPAAEAAKSELALQFTGKEVYLDETVYLVGSKNAPSFTIQPDTKLEFSYTLPSDLPSTFKGQYGKIKYYIEFTYHLPWRFDESVAVPLHIIHAVDLPTANPAAMLPYSHQTSQSFGLFRSGAVIVQVWIPRGGSSVGDRIPVQVVISNSSPVNVEKVKFALVQLIEYHSTSPARFMRTECIQVARKEAGGVCKRTQRKYEHQLDIPKDLPATRSGHGIINIRYEIRVTAKLNGLRRFVTETVPFVVASLPPAATVTTMRNTTTAVAAAASATTAEADELPQRAVPETPSTSVQSSMATLSIGWQPPPSSPMTSSMHNGYGRGYDDSSANVTPTPSTSSTAYPSLQSLPIAMNGSGQYSSPYPPHYTNCMSSPYAVQTVAYPLFQPLFQPHFVRSSIDCGSMPSAPPLDGPSAASCSHRNSLSNGSVMSMSAPTYSPPSYEQMYGPAVALDNDSEESSEASGTSTASPTATASTPPQPPDTSTPPPPAASSTPQQAPSTSSDASAVSSPEPAAADVASPAQTPSRSRGARRKQAPRPIPA